MLTRRPFGESGLAISPIGLGTVKFGRDKGLKHRPFAIPTDREVSNLLALAADLGVNLLDTAPAYGSSEERLGKLIAGHRDRWVICTKAGEEFDDATGESRFDFTNEHLRFSVERSLKRLGVEALDIVLIHSDGNDAEIVRAGALQCLADLKAEGKIRAIGMSTKTVEGGLLVLEQADCVMVTLNLAQSEDLPVIDRAAQLGKGVLVKKPLASGQFDAGATGDPLLASFRWIFSQRGVSAAVVGTVNPDHLRADVATCARSLSERSH